MIFWFIYVLIAFIFSCFISYIFNKSLLTFYICFISLLTPAQVEIGLANYAPAIFTFLFNLLFDQDYSLRVLRPLLISLPLSLICLWLVLSFKRRLF